MSTLTFSEARDRAALLTVDAYELDVDLTGDPGSFHTTTTVRFTAVAGSATFVEVRPWRLHQARLNGKPLDPATLVDGRLPLPALAEANELVVTAEYGYSHASEGMHRFTDPADDAVYVYAQPSIAQAPAFMACFDQPDLKAPVTLRVTADPSWQVRGNSAGVCVAPGRWEFPPTPPIATYLITLAAGPYHEVRSVHDGVPLGLYARASLAAHLDREAPELFEITAACLDRFHAMFGMRYPFGGYDQVFAPEFSWGAMEFPGCVLIRDELVFRSAVSDGERQRRAVLLAHEMAHMWFGNLVTMRWWDDLWLNESFADYLGWRVVAEATRWRTAWTSYSVLRKTWGYVGDQRPSTHPVAPVEVTDTAAALANFDGVSYAKGSAVLRQLVAWVGDEAFLSGLRDHFRAHAYGNATLADLLDALSRSSGRDLDGWAQRWLRASQVTTLRPEAPDDGTGHYARVHLRQEAPEAYPTLRPHRLTIGVYDRPDGAAVGSTDDGDADDGDADGGGALTRRTRVVADVDPDRDGPRTAVDALTGTPVGQLLLVDDEDLTYAKVRWPAHTPAPAALLPRMRDSLARAVLWVTLWDACRDAELPPGDLVRAVAAALPDETEVSVAETMLATAVDPVADRYLAADDRRAAYAALVDACRTLLERSAPDSAWRLPAARGMIRCAGEEDVDWLAAWRMGEAPTGVEVDAELRWLLLWRLVVHGAAGEDEIAAEEARDRTARGAQEALRCRAAQPEPAAKQRAWQLVTGDRELSNRMLVAAADGFWQPEHAALTTEYVPRYFTEIGATAAWRSAQLLAVVARAAYPGYAVTPETLAAAESALARDDLHPIVRRELVDGTDDLRRALRVRGAVPAAPAPA